MRKEIYKEDLVHPDLSYKIIGAAFEVYNQIGGGHKESVYQKGMNVILSKIPLNFREQVYFPIKIDNVTVGRNYFDFIIEEKIIVEIKSLERFSKAHYDQTLNYLHVSGLKLALLITFGKDEVRYRRVINFSEIERSFENS